MQTINAHNTRVYLQLKRAEVSSGLTLQPYEDSISLDTIKTLRLQNHVTIPCLISVGKCLSSLIQLSLERCSFGDDGVLSVSLIFRNLRKLSVRANEIGVRGVRSVAENLRRLEELDIGLNNLDDECGVVIASKMKSLKRLNIERNRIGDSGVIRISKNLKNLQIFKHGFTQTSRRAHKQMPLLRRNPK